MKKFIATALVAAVMSASTAFASPAVERGLFLLGGLVVASTVTYVVMDDADASVLPDHIRGLDEQEAEAFSAEQARKVAAAAADQAISEMKELKAKADTAKYEANIVADTLRKEIGEDKTTAYRNAKSAIGTKTE
jgi:hypothetical protein